MLHHTIEFNNKEILNYFQNLVETGGKSRASYFKSYQLIERKNNININAFRYENKQVYPVYSSRNKFKDHVETLLLGNEDKSQYV